MKNAIWLVTVMFGLIAMTGCNETQQCTANCGWVMRAQQQAQMQDRDDPDEAYFAQYERTFKLNERMYYRTEPDVLDATANTTDGPYVWGGTEQVASGVDIQ